MADPDTEPGISERRKQTIDFLAGRSKLYVDDHPDWLIPEEGKKVPEKWRKEMLEDISTPVTPSSLTEVAMNIRTLGQLGTINIREIREVDTAGRHQLRASLSRGDKSGHPYRWTEWYSSAGRLVRFNQDHLHVELDYDDEGYLTRMREWQYGGFGHQDTFEYDKDNGKVVPIQMTRRLFAGLGSNRPSKVLGPPITIDLNTGEYLNWEPKGPLPELSKASFDHPFQSVEPRNNYSGIICPEAKDLVRALYAFGGIRESFNADVDSYASASGGAEMAHIFDHIQGDPEEIKGNIRLILEHIAPEAIPDDLKDVESTNLGGGLPFSLRDEEDTFFKHFDYDGYGGFHKAVVDIKKYPNGGFVVKFSQGVRGNKAEEQLVEILKLRRRLSGASVIARAAVRDEIYAIDVQSVLDEAIAEVGVSTTGRKFKTFISQIMEDAQEGMRSFIGRAVIPLDDLTELSARLNMGEVSDNMKEPKGKKHPLIIIKEGRVYGYPAVDWDDEQRIPVPVVTLTLQPPEDKVLTIWQEAALIAKRDKIQAKLKKRVRQ